MPVGADQVAHVELTREVARRFNHLFGEILCEAQVLLTPTPKLPGTDGRKMSKSYDNYILLTDSEAEIRRKLKPMVTDPARVRRTDPGNPDVCPVGDLHKVFSSAETLQRVYDGCTHASIGCIECKNWLADAVVAALAPMQQRRQEYAAQPELVTQILEAGNARATVAAEQTMESVRRAMGIRR